MQKHRMIKMSIKVKRNKNIERRVNIEIINNLVSIRKINPFLKLMIRLVIRINDFLLSIF